MKTNKKKYIFIINFFNEVINSIIKVMEHEICSNKIIYAFMIYLHMTQLIALILNSHTSKLIFNPLVVYLSSSF